MKLNDVRPNIEISSDLEEKFFSIQDTGMIFDILRNKMYSNPILAICREISCNARDAHREVGKAEVPIHIHLPNSLEKYYKIRDFGPGISPDRMANIFIKYTASTKRDDNIQTGGFGLGAKTPFSYSDTFTILTNHDGIRYQYSCNIDETRVGKLMLLSQTSTDDQNGTEIQIPVQPKNFTEFVNYTEQACRYWDIKPIIKGGDIDWKTDPKILEGKNWAITSSKDWQRNAKIIIDGVEYPLELDSLKKYTDSKLIDVTRGNFIMYFDIGELSLSASRENIYIDDRTKKILKDRLDNVVKEIKTSISDKINNKINLWDANLFIRKDLDSIFTDLKFLGDLYWKEFKIPNGYIQTNCPTLSFNRGRYSYKHGNDPNKLTRSKSSHINYEHNNWLFINDLPLKEVCAKHVKKVFEDNPSLKSIQVICPTDNITLDSLNKSIHLDQMAPRLLSSITKASGRKYASSTSSRLVICAFNTNTRTFRKVSFKYLKEDKRKKVLFYISKNINNSRHIILNNGKALSMKDVSNIKNKYIDYSFYGIEDIANLNKFGKFSSDFELSDDFIKNKILENKTIDFIAAKIAVNNNYSFRKLSVSSENAARLASLVKSKSSIYIKYFEFFKRVKSIDSNNISLLNIYESINGEIDDKDISNYIKINKDYDYNLLHNKYIKTYPLFEHIYDIYRDNIIDGIADYINLIDKNEGSLL